MGKKKQGDIPITHGQQRPKNKGGRPPGPAPSGPALVLAGHEKIMKKLQKQLCQAKTLDCKLVKEYVAAVGLYSDLHKLAHKDTPQEQSIGDVFQHGMRGAYEEILAAHSAEAEGTDIAPTDAAADPTTVQDTEEAEG